MNNDQLKFRIFDKKEKRYRGTGGDEIFMLTSDGELVFWNVRDGKHRAADKSLFVLERCTGFKDENGCLIYEGDIIEKPDPAFCLSKKFFRQAVYFVPHYSKFFAMKPGSGIRHPLDSDDALNYRIIGNVNENNKLMDSKISYDRYEK